MVPYITVVKTTIYLPDDLKAAVEQAARRRDVSEAEVIRDAVRAAVGADRPRPRGALFSAEPISDRVDELLEGFGDW